MTNGLTQSFIDGNIVWIVWVGLLIFTSLTIALCMGVFAYRHRKMRKLAISNDPHPMVIERESTASLKGMIMKKCKNCGSHATVLAGKEVCSSVECRYTPKG